MEIEKTISVLNEIRINTGNSKNKKYSEKFVRLLIELQGMNLIGQKAERLDSELKLIRQNFEIEKNNVIVKNELKKFIKFLKSEFSMTMPWYYTKIGALIGLITTVFFGFKPLIFGALFGALYGYYYDEKSKMEGKKLKTELNEFIC